MKQYPVLETERLMLRGFALEDAPEVQRLAGAKEIARMTLNIPYPYEAGAAEQWISNHQESFDKGEGVDFAMVVARPGSEEESLPGSLVGSIGLVIGPGCASAELGYWVGVPYWDQGYCSEAAVEVVRYGFEQIGLHRIHSHHFGSNPASGAVMRKIGMSYEGTRREHLEKWGHYEDSVQYGLLFREWRDRAR